MTSNSECDCKCLEDPGCDCPCLAYRQPTKPDRALVLIAVFASLLLGAIVLASHWEPQGVCFTDTECMEMFGGDGGPEPVMQSI